MAGETGQTTSRLLNRLAYDFANKATDITTAATGDFVLIADVSDDYEVKYGDGANLLEMIGSTVTAAEMDYLDIATLGTGAASKAVVLDADGAYVGPTTADTKFTWSVTSDSTDGGTSVEPFVHNTTMTGAGGVGGRARFELDTNVTLGSWANALKAQLQLGASGKVTGLGSAFVAELIMGAGAADGTYAPLELELGMPSGALTGTETAFINFTAYGADASTLDDNGFLFSISGVTKGAGDLLSDTTSGSTARPVQVLKVKTPDGTRFLPLYSTVAIAA
ncbi:MAG TPA: hypothetical protein VF982_00245 [Anaerolineales bacterium]